MRVVINFLLTLITILAFFSCKKGDTSSSFSASGVGGNWKFISISVHTQRTIQWTYDGSAFRSISNSDYTSTNDSGKVTFTSGAMIETGISYKAYWNFYTYDYINNQLTDSLSDPDFANISQFSSTSFSKLVGLDSLYITGQSLFSTKIGPFTSASYGAKFTINGSTLMMTSSAVRDTVINIGNMVTAQHDSLSAVTTLEKE